MPTFKKKPQMTAAEFNAALRDAGFGVDHGRIVDVSGKCPGSSVPQWSGCSRSCSTQPVDLGAVCPAPQCAVCGAHPRVRHAGNGMRREWDHGIGPRMCYKNRWGRGREKRRPSTSPQGHGDGP
jgi:hypothetical protein